MVKFPEANARLHKNKFACKRCKAVIKSTNIRVLAGKTRCRKCLGKALRPLRKK